MRQRLLLSVALMRDPRLLLLDEPFNGLDPDAVAWWGAFLRNLGTNGRTVVVVSHHLRELEGSIGRVLVMSRGRVIHDAEVAHFVTQHSEARVVVRCDKPRVLLTALRESDIGGADSTADGDWVSVFGCTPDDVARVASDAGVFVRELRADRGTLEGAFLRSMASPT